MVKNVYGHVLPRSARPLEERAGLGFYSLPKSSLNSEEGMGVASLSVIYASIIISSMFLPPILIKNLGCKWTIVISMGCYVAYSFGNLYPGWATLIPTSVILGLGGSPLWSAKCTFLTISGNLQAEKENKRGQDVINQYFGMFFLIFQSSAVWGNLMSSLIFGSDSDIGVGILAMILVAVFLDNIDRETAREFRGNREPFCSTFLATFKHLKDKRQLLLIPLTMYSGFEQGFLSGDYTKFYVTCALGIHFVGYVMICFGATNSICSFTFGRLAQYTGRAALFAFALYGVLFPEQKEAAFANYRMWESVGFVIAFAYSNFICLNTKLYILIAVLISAMVFYGWVEWEEHKKPGVEMCKKDTEEKALPMPDEYIKAEEKNKLRCFCGQYSGSDVLSKMQ
ncbi:hypothetical protein AAFF_G00020810 [Aldrovandia affinis]|uniref:Protein unc-93 homolog A n=1 Tax=Aldrovandia affinis TaxID=143900 RepID=A0AAD7S576_9TELE|nr:hypothetical protein AAFF_G00020810 [Aldrovandia affinis]